MGDVQSFGVFQRLGIALFVISFGLVVVAFGAPGRAIYAVFVAAHVLLYSGFVIAAVADYLGRRRFSLGRFVYMGGMAFLYLILGPIVMGAAAAAIRVH